MSCRYAQGRLSQGDTVRRNLLQSMYGHQERHLCLEP